MRRMAPGGRRHGRDHSCDVPTSPHSLTYARFYPCGWRCDRHSPSAMAKRPPATGQTPPRQDTNDG